ncbi:cytidine deaminase [Cryomorphaceae bacterium 1068]|nr:cytidine deaminase [Cryomorphaceae bacterium 1068]
MENKEIHIRYERYASADELSADDRLLFNQAIEASKSAYAPYSKFSVGAAVLLENGEVVKGSNQENMAYPSGLCAERVALFAAASNFPNIPFKALAIMAQPISSGQDTEVTPCGSCRQVMLEYERILSQDIRIITGAPNGPISIIENARSLLPMAFFDAGLGKDIG